MDRTWHGGRDSATVQREFVGSRLEEPLMARAYELLVAVCRQVLASRPADSQHGQLAGGVVGQDSRAEPVSIGA